MSHLIQKAFDAHEAMLRDLKGASGAIESIGQLLVSVLKSDHKVLLAGNGGSAADAQHFAAELAGRYALERKGVPALALTTDTSALTAIANDYDFRYVYSRQVEALGRKGDLLLLLSTSGHSENLIVAADLARKQSMITVGLLGKTGGALAGHVDHCLIVPSQETARIQEAHLMIYHIWCAMVDEAFVDEPSQAVGMP
jgi:D-sedoheptulose 7-phosphate isomerase